MANKHLQHRPAVVMLLALILMAAVTASTIGISVVINRTLIQARNLDSFILASLAADSGIERGLAVVKTGRGAGTTLANTVTASGITPTTLSGSGAQYSVAGVNSPVPISVAELSANESISFDILKPTSGSIPHFLKIKATCDSSCTNANPDSLFQLAWVVIAGDGTATYSNRVIYSVSEYQAGSGQIADLNNVRTDVSDSTSPFTGSGGVLGYRIEITALRGALLNLSAVPCNDSLCAPPVTCDTSICDGDVTNIIGRIRLTSTGEAGFSSERTRSIKTAQVLWQPPSSGLLQYVLFSEESIIP